MFMQPIQPSIHYRLQLFSTKTTHGMPPICHGMSTWSHNVISTYLQAQCDKFRQCLGCVTCISY
jgi:hypothetical protein